MQQDKEIKSKKIKDPIYGYITIPQEYITNVVDTPVFQRLRRVLQTSYSPLYASTLHNRFVHSLGVYHLGEIVAKRFMKVILEGEFLEKEKVEKYSRVYTLACLLHDVGHAPFSHTGEFYYKNENKSSVDLHNRLCSFFDSSEFKKDIPAESAPRNAAPHEIMSAIIGLKEFGDIIGDDESKEFFARCITGYIYKETMPKDDIAPEKDIKNCFIDMLNSNVIDVDRLDYLIRDAYTSGFETVNIDYTRLLRALTIVIKEGHYITAYEKGAVSIIENVVYAYDGEKKWIQNHPVVLYETYILSHILEKLCDSLDVIDAENGNKSRKLFSEETLSMTGQVLNNDIKVSLMCDDDIIYLSKNVFADSLSKELFDRNRRRHPVWKSEAEYRGYIKFHGDNRETQLLDTISRLCLLDNPYNMLYCIINESLVKRIDQDLRAELYKQKEKSNPLKENENQKHIDTYKMQLQLCRFLLEQARKYEWEPEFLFIEATMFDSNFKKDNLKNMPITLGEGTYNIRKLREICPLLDAQEKDRNFYYLYYRSKKKRLKEDDINFSAMEFCESLLDSVKVH
ncbi:MAG: HD domain-containing protein [Roseburia sp.]|nr:HD domain-containing protein [Roseburia sp.]